MEISSLVRRLWPGRTGATSSAAPAPLPPSAADTTRTSRLSSWLGSARLLTTSAIAVGVIGAGVLGGVVADQYLAGSKALDEAVTVLDQQTFSVRRTVEPLPFPETVVSPDAPALPGPALQQLFSALQSSKDFQGLLKHQVQNVQAQIQQQIDSSSGLTHTDLVDMDAKLPPHLAKLVHHDTLSVPVVVNESGTVSPIQIGIDVQPVHLAHPPQGPAGSVYLGSYQTSLSLDTPHVHANVKAQVGLETDGAATTAALQTAVKDAQGLDPHSPRGQVAQANIRRLQERQQAIAQLNKVVSDCNVARDLAQVVSDQGLQAQVDASVPSVPLLQGTIHIFAAPGGPQGLPQVVLTQNLATDFGDVHLSNIQLQSLPHADASASPAVQKLHEVLAHRILKTAQEFTPDAQKMFPSLATDAARSTWQDAIVMAQARVNDTLAAAVQSNLGAAGAPKGVDILVARPIPKPPKVHGGAPVVDGSALVVLPPATVNRLASNLLTSPLLQAPMAQARSQVQAFLAHPTGLQGSEDVDIRFQGLDVPLSVHHDIHLGAIPARVDITPEILPPDQRTAAPAGGVYLGSFKSQVWATQAHVPVTATVSGALTMDTKATQADLAADLAQAKAEGISTVSHAPHSTCSEMSHASADRCAPDAALRADIQRLEGRLAAIRKLQDLNLQPAGREALAALSHQEASIDTTVNMSTTRPLVVGVDHLWLTSDGLKVTGSVDTPGVSSVSLSNTHIRAQSHAVPAGFEPEERLIVQQLQRQGEAAIQNVGGQLTSSLTDLTHRTWDSSLGLIQDAVNQSFNDVTTRDIPVPARADLPVRNMTVRLARLTTTPQGDVAAILSTPGVHESFAQDLASLHPQSGIDTVLSGASVNSLLRDTRDGGNIDWQDTLKTMASKYGLKALQFNRDAQGHYLTPHIVTRGGQLRVEFDMSGQLSGGRPAAVLTGVLDGAGSILEAPARLGDQAAHHFGAPTTPLPAVAHGVHRVSDGLIDGILGVLSKVTQPVIALHVSVPLHIDSQDGVLVFSPQAQGLDISDGQGKSTLSPGLVSGIAQSIAKKVGPGAAAPYLARAAVPVDLRPTGVRFTQTSIAPGASGQPDLHLHMELTPRFNLNHLPEGSLPFSVPHGKAH